MGKWGTPVAIGAGDLLVTPFPGGGEVYPIKASLFVHTYARYVAGDDPREDAEARGRTERGGGATGRGASGSRRSSLITLHDLHAKPPRCSSSARSSAASAPR